MTDEQALANGHKARRELELTDHVLTGLRQAFLEEILTTPPEQAAKRDRMIVGAQIVDAVRNALNECVAAGEVADYRLKLAEQNLLRP